MDPHQDDAISGRPDTGNVIPAAAGAPGGLTRRQLGLLFAGVSGLLVSGTVYGIAAKTATDARATAATSFGSLRVLRAGRFARLGTNGMPSALRGREALAAMEGRLRVPLAGAAGAGVESGHPGHGGHSGGSTTLGNPENSVPGLRWRQPANSTWGDIVVTEFEVRNEAQDPLAFSPGQLRLVLGTSGRSVTAQDCAEDPRPLAPGTTARLWVSHLAPESANDFFLEFADPWAGSTAILALPVMITLEA